MSDGPLLFGALPDDPAPLRPDDAALLRSLPFYPDLQTVAWDVWQEAACRRLEARGYVKIHRWKTDPIAIRPTYHVGRVPV